MINAHGFAGVRVRECVVRTGAAADISTTGGGGAVVVVVVVVRWRQKRA